MNDKDESGFTAAEKHKDAKRKCKVTSCNTRIQCTYFKKLPLLPLLSAALCTEAWCPRRRAYAPRPLRRACTSETPTAGLRLRGAGGSTARPASRAAPTSGGGGAWQQKQQNKPQSGRADQGNTEHTRQNTTTGKGRRAHTRERKGPEPNHSRYVAM